MIVMDFIGAIGKLSTKAGLKEISDIFGSVDKLLEGKKYPQNARALRMLMEEIL